MAVTYAMTSLKQAVSFSYCLFNLNNLHLWPALLQQLFLDVLEKNNLTLI